MTNQVQSELLFAGMDHQSNEWVYSPWLPVAGYAASFGLEVLQKNFTLTVTWNVETRTREDPSSVTDVLSSDQTQVGAGLSVADPASIGTAPKELVRYEVAVGGSPSAAEWVMLRVLQPSWQLDGQ